MQIWAPLVAFTQLPGIFSSADKNREKIISQNTTDGADKNIP